MLLTLFAVQAFAKQPAECPATGNAVTFRKVQEVYTAMAGSIPQADLTRGEFETTAQVEARQARVTAVVPFSQTMLLEGRVARCSVSSSPGAAAVASAWSLGRLACLSLRAKRSVSITVVAMVVSR